MQIYKQSRLKDANYLDERVKQKSNIYLMYPNHDCTTVHVRTEVHSCNLSRKWFTL